MLDRLRDLWTERPAVVAAAVIAPIAFVITLLVLFPGRGRKCQRRSASRGWPSPKLNRRTKLKLRLLARPPLFASKRRATISRRISRTFGRRSEKTRSTSHRPEDVDEQG